MLGSFMEELQITPEQFEVACLAGKHGSSGLAFHHGLFQQVHTADRFLCVCVLDKLRTIVNVLAFLFIL